VISLLAIIFLNWSAAGCRSCTPAGEQQLKGWDWACATRRSGLVVALVGLQMNIVSESAYALVIFMTGITTLVAAPIMKLGFS